MEPSKYRYYVGSGGKTTTIFRTAEQLAKQGKKVLITTTTHMALEPRYMAADNGTALERQLQSGILLYGQKNEPKINLGITAAMVEQGIRLAEVSPILGRLTDLADVVLVEADGSKRLPLKYPAAHEPVILSDVSQIYVLAGLSGLDGQWQAVCHRWQLTDNRKADQIVTEQEVAKLLFDGYLTNPKVTRYCDDISVVLNQADNEALIKRAIQIYAHLNRLITTKQLNLPYHELIQSAVRPVKTMTIVLMAAGFSRRFGTNKLYHLIEGKPMYQYGLEMLCQLQEIANRENQTADRYCRLDLVVVTKYEPIIKAAQEKGFRTFYNDCSEQGISASVRIGTEQAKGEDIMFLPADQPYIKADTIWNYMMAYYQSNKSLAACLVQATKLQPNGQRAIKLDINPASKAEPEPKIPATTYPSNRLSSPKIFNHQYRSALLQVEGDSGGREIFAQHAQDRFYYPVRLEEFQDIDKR